jgi:hypothetical protein
METILQGQKKIDAVYTHDDDMAMGVVQAIKAANREDEMFVTGAGGSKDAMNLISQGGLYRATFLYNPSMSGSAVSIAKLIAEKKGLSELREPEVPSRIELPATTVTKENVAGVTESWTRQTSLLGRRSSSFPSAKTVRARGQGAIRLGHDAFEHREVDLVQILEVQASHASGVRAQLLELLVISANAIGEIDAGGGLARSNPAAGASPSQHSSS